MGWHEQPESPIMRFGAGEGVTSIVRQGEFDRSPCR